MISNKEIDLEISFYEDLRRKYKKRISHYPEGNINFKFEHNCYRAYIGINHKQKYLGAKDWTLTSRLIKKKIDTLSLKYIEENMKLFLKTVAPDFTIKRKSDGKIIIWEHFGMMDDPEYYESRMEVLSDYHHAGWLPYENFIATFGERNSPIDMTVIETICETMLR